VRSDPFAEELLGQREMGQDFFHRAHILDHLVQLLVDLCDFLLSFFAAVQLVQLSLLHFREVLRIYEEVETSVQTVRLDPPYELVDQAEVDEVVKVDELDFAFVQLREAGKVHRLVQL